MNRPSYPFQPDMSHHRFQPLVENNIIKPLIDAVLRDSVDTLSTFRANEILALGISEANAVYDDVEHFLYSQVIPSAIQVATFASSIQK